MLLAVRTGDLSQFQSALVTHSERFSQDSTYKLILRLRHNVIKTGVRSLSLAYSLISLRDICVKLHLDSEEDAEYIVGKAVRDGVIEARVDHTNGWMISQARGTASSGASIEGLEGVYATAEPQEVFTKRVGFCLDLHNESVKVSIETCVSTLFPFCPISWVAISIRQISVLSNCYPVRCGSSCRSVPGGFIFAVPRCNCVWQYLTTGTAGFILL
jgi:hypothetical protein